MAFYTKEVTAEADRIIARAKEEVDLTLTYDDFEVYHGEIYLDGMDPDEWIDMQGEE